MNKYLIRYLRLSKDDSNVGESNSIASQRQIIESYVSSSDEFYGMKMIEFSDDGYTGTNFNRPGVTQLLELVKKGEAACIIVKDFSRFGRQYIEVSKFIEQIFPCLGVRFISVNDHYDSNSHKGTTAELDVPVRNMINAFYSKDISRKAKSAIRTKKKQGILLSKIAIFGYKVDESETENRRAVIDEPAAEIVRRIFALANNGFSSFQTAEKLNDDNVITPASYKAQNGCLLAFKTSNRALWTVSMVTDILRDERYTGTFVGCMRESIKLGTNKKKRKPKDEWIRKPNAHPAIISPELFNTIREKRKKFNITYNKANTNRIFFKKILCGHCDHIMRYQTSKSRPQYVCETVRYSDKFGCNREKISEQDILDTVKIVINEQMKVLLEFEKICNSKKRSMNKNINSAKAAVERLDNEIKKLQGTKRLLYERFKKNEIDKSLYTSERKIVDTNISAKTAERDALLVTSENQVEVYNSAQVLFQSFLKFKELPELDKDMTDKLIEAIYVYSDKSIEVKFSFKDKPEQVINALRGNIE